VLKICSNLYVKGGVEIMIKKDAQTRNAMHEDLFDEGNRGETENRSGGIHNPSDSTGSTTIMNPGDDYKSSGSAGNMGGENSGSGKMGGDTSDRQKPSDEDMRKDEI